LRDLPKLLINLHRGPPNFLKLWSRSPNFFATFINFLKTLIKVSKLF
jgi:hypothetical protein